MSQAHKHVLQFNELIEAMRLQGVVFNTGGDVRKPNLLDGESPENFEIRAQRLKTRDAKKVLERTTITFPAMSSGVKAFKAALKASGWRPVSAALFPKEENPLVQSKEKGQPAYRVKKLAYHIEARHRLDDKSRPMAILCPQEGMIELTTAPSLRKRTAEEMRDEGRVKGGKPSPARVPYPMSEPNKRTGKCRPLTKLSPVQWDLDRFQPMLSMWVVPGMNEVEAQEAALDGLCNYHDATPEELRIEMCKKAIKRWAPLSRELEGMDKYKENLAEWVPAGTKQEQAVDLVIEHLAPLLVHLPETWRVRTARQVVETWGPIGRENDPTISSEEQLARLAKKARKAARRLRHEQVAAEPKSLGEVVADFNRRVQDVPHALPTAPIKAGVVQVTEVLSSAPIRATMSLSDRLNSVLGRPSASGSAMALAFVNARK